MILIVSAITIITIGIVVSCFLQKKRNFEHKVNECLEPDVFSSRIDVSKIETEFDRIDELQKNIRKIRDNVNNIAIPIPEREVANENAASSLNKLSNFFEKHSLAAVGTEQLILSIIPTSQIGQSLHSIVEILPCDIAQNIWGSAFSAIKDNASTLLYEEGLSRFISGMGNLGHMQMMSMMSSLEHHQFVSAALTPIKSGAIEALGVHDMVRELSNSITLIGDEVSTAMEASQSFQELTDASNIDLTGHIPVVTIAVSTFREIQLLADDKTDPMSSLKNISLDVVGAGVGGAAGAKAGVAAGSFLGPFGAIAGGILGGIGGAIAGRTLTNELKLKPLKKALSRYQKGYYEMREDTDNKSRETLTDIRIYAEQKRSDFQDAELIENIPITDTSSIPERIAVTLYSFVLNEVVELKVGVSKLRKSIWYSENKYDDVINEYSHQIHDIEAQLPDIDLIKENPRLVIDILVNLRMPHRKNNSRIQARLEECSDEMKEINDKNNSKILVWSYMVNNLHQKTLNDIADYSNEKMKGLNLLFTEWTHKMRGLQSNVEKEKSKLGYK